MIQLKYKHFEQKDTKINGPMARNIIKFFFGEPQIPYPATENDCEFAQSILLAAICASNLMSTLEKLVDGVAKFDVGTNEAKDFLKGVIITCGKLYLLEDGVAISAMEKEGIYKIVRDTIVLRFRSNHDERLAAGTRYLR